MDSQKMASSTHVFMMMLCATRILQTLQGVEYVAVHGDTAVQFEVAVSVCWTDPSNEIPLCGLEHPR